jgi:hypothetical protein
LRVGGCGVCATRTWTYLVRGAPTPVWPGKWSTVSYALRAAYAGTLPVAR